MNFSIGAIVACSLVLSGCGNVINLTRKAKQKRAEKAMLEMTKASGDEASARLGNGGVGHVTKVDSGGGFVLIRLRNGLTIPAGMALESRTGLGGKVSGKIQVTPEGKGQLIAADIVSGAPLKDDIVIPVKGSGTQVGPQLVPVAGSTSVDDTKSGVLEIDPASIRPEDLPASTLDAPVKH